MEDLEEETEGLPLVNGTGADRLNAAGKSFSSGDASDDASDDGFKLDDDAGSGPKGPPPLAYDGVSDTVPGLPTRADLVRQADTAGLSDILAAHVRGGKPIFFMPNDVNETNEYVGGVPVYKLHLFGVLPNGAKTHVVLDGIDVYFDVRVPPLPAPGQRGAKPQDFGAYLRQLFCERNLELGRVEDLEAFLIRGFQEAKVAWKRLYFSNVQARKKAIDTVRSLGHETASDDRSGYFRMAARVYGLVLTDWGLLKGYRYYRGGAHPEGGSDDRSAPDSPLCEHVFRLDVRQFAPLVDPMASKELQEQRLAAKRGNPGLSRDKTLVMAWDIETYDSARTGDLPRATNPKTCVFMICAAFHWKDDPVALHRVCLVDVAAEPDGRWTTVVCGSEEGVLRGFAAVYRHFAPDIVAGFNDGDYDWPYVIEKARQYRILGLMVETITALPRRRTTEEEDALRWNVSREKRIKISAEETAFVTFLKVPGSIPVDVRVMFRQLFPKAEVGKGSSLNFYLEACNLASKIDMPCKRMWNIYAEALAAPTKPSAGMRHVAHYCGVDAKRCQELLVKRNVINDRREVATLSYVSLYDAIYYAGGHKVCNMLAAYAIRRGLACSNISGEESEHGKYPGAWVFHPEKGLVPDPTLEGTVALEKARREYLRLAELAETGCAAAARLEAARSEALSALEGYRDPGRPVTGLDFSSLYPSIIMTYNLSPEKFVGSLAEAERLQAKGVALHYTEFLFGGQKVYGWFVRHNGVSGDYGLYPSILVDLFEKRAVMKKKLAVQEGLKEHMEAVASAVQAAAAARGTLKATVFPDVFAEELAAQQARVAKLELEAVAAKAEGRTDAWRADLEAKAAGRNVEYMAAVAKKPAADQQKAFQSRYRDTCFEFTSIDSKQRALKLFMNTFYGEAGRSVSPFFLLQLAGGVTTAGQYNIKMVADFVAKKGFRIKYGDTDSLYLSPPERVFAEADRRYALGEASKERYWTEMVKITMAELDGLRDQVNAHLASDNGTPHLTMAYEEVLYPVVFTGKKKYFGVAHVSVPNFRPRKLFIRGIDVVKQGQTKLAKTIGLRVMWAAVSLANTRDLLSIVEQELQNAVEDSAQWAFDDFIQSDAWKPNKDNKSVQRFIARMRVRVAEETADNERRASRGLKPRKALYAIPDPGERFRYILAKPSAAFSLCGLKTNPKKGDVMEYAEVARALKIPVDVGQYLKSYVVGLCGRFVNYAERFLPPPQARCGMNDKQLDKKSQDAAKKYLEGFIAGLQNADPKTVQKRGYAYKRAWKHAAQECSDVLYSTLGPVAEVLHGDRLAWSDFLPTEDDEEAVAVLAAKAKKLANELSSPEADAGYVAAYAEALGIAEDGSDAGGPAPNAPADATSTANNLYQAARALLAVPARSRQKHSPAPLRGVILSALNQRESALRARLSELAPLVANTAAGYEACLARVVHLWRAREHAERPDELGAGPVEAGDSSAPWAFNPNEASLAHLGEVRRAWYELVGVYRARAQHLAITAHLTALKDCRQRWVARPDQAAIRRTIAESAKRLPPLGIGTVGCGGY